ncbi:MAG TPA: xanthine dehydrogenase family protein subunit M [Methylomirabilota bacterium]|nr:xanthine dehydrogenase family protein subunit M [Methylomirabilota bacterium]
MKRFEVVQADSVEDCLRALAAHGREAKLLAGGTDLLPQLKNGMLAPRYMVDLSRVTRLRTLDVHDGLRVGAAVTARELELNQAVQTRYPALAESGALVGSVQVRNLATVGGNLCNAAPSADMAPPLLALEAEAVIAGPRGERRVPLSAFFADVRRTVLAPDELLLELVIPAPAPRSGGRYLRHTPRRELDIAVVGVASQLSLSDGICARARIALAAVAPIPLRATAAEQALEGRPLTAELIEEAAGLAAEAARPISDQRGSAEFRRHLVRVLTRRTLTSALARARS